MRTDNKYVKCCEIPIFRSRIDLDFTSAAKAIVVRVFGSSSLR